MSFQIQACDPLIVPKVEGDPMALSWAVEKVFPLYTEDALINWNGIYIPLSYKYDISVLIGDLLIFLTKLMSADKGETSFGCGSDSFTTEWHASWEDGKIDITSKWEIVRGPILELLNEHNKQELSLEEFLCEWKALLLKIFVCLQMAGYDELDVPQMKELRELEAKIPNFGMIYHSPR